MHLYRQVADDLRAEIRSGALPSGSKLPNERELADIYGVARVTIKSAVLLLREEGYLTVITGRGTYVTR